MFSPRKQTETEDWFQRLNTPLKRLPAQERAELHQEVRQHLEALAQAHEELGSPSDEAWSLSLAQFGDPAKIGRRMAWEWRRKQGWVSEKLAAVFYGVGAFAASTAGIMVLSYLVPALMNIIVGTGAGNPVPVNAYDFVAVPIIAGLAVGQKYPHQALTGAFYAAIALPILPTLARFSVSALQGSLGPVEIWHGSVAYAIMFVGWLLLTCGAAYVTSARKRREWYRPCWADFKMTPPRERAQTSR